MGVSGSGKSTVGEMLAERLGWTFQEGDALHPEANIAKMRAGTPLTDSDRLPWLKRVAAWIDERRSRQEPGIITCSTLKQSYRRMIIGERLEARLVYLRGGQSAISQRVAARTGHFMPASLLQSQFNALEEPAPAENAIIIDLAGEAQEAVDTIIRQLGVAATIGKSS